MATLHVDVVSAEEAIFSGEAKFVVLPGEAGELGILPGHTPLISRIRPGTVKIVRADQGEENIFVAGGILEVQPGSVTVLADTAIRAADLDEARAWKRASALKRRCATPGQGRHRRGRSRARDAGGASRGRAQAAPRRPLALSGRAIGACPGSGKSGLWPLFCLRGLACASSPAATLRSLRIALSDPQH